MNELLQKIYNALMLILVLKFQPKRFKPEELPQELAADVDLHLILMGWYQVRTNKGQQEANNFALRMINVLKYNLQKETE